jgi:hypothetical protein
VTAGDLPQMRWKPGSASNPFELHDLTANIIAAHNACRHATDSAFRRLLPLVREMGTVEVQ